MKLSQKIIISTAILHNIATIWNEELPEDPEDPDGGRGNANQDQQDQDPDPD